MLELQACTFKPQTTPVPQYLLRQLRQQYEQQQEQEQQGEGQYEGQYDAMHLQGQYEAGGAMVYYDEHGELYYADDGSSPMPYGATGQGFGFASQDQMSAPGGGMPQQYSAGMEYEQVAPDM